MSPPRADVNAVRQSHQYPIDVSNGLKSQVTSDFANCLLHHWHSYFFSVAEVMIDRSGAHLLFLASFADPQIAMSRMQRVCGGWFEGRTAHLPRPFSCQLVRHFATASAVAGLHHRNRTPL